VEVSNKLIKEFASNLQALIAPEPRDHSAD
jgi:hypothetical protein